MKAMHKIQTFYRISDVDFMELFMKLEKNSDWRLDYPAFEYVTEDDDIQFIVSPDNTSLILYDEEDNRYKSMEFTRRQQNHLNLKLEPIPQEKETFETPYHEYQNAVKRWILSLK